MLQVDYEYFGKVLKERSGLVLAPGKEYVLESRLLPIAREAGLEGMPGLVAELRKPASEELWSRVTEAMTTNESYFFRDIAPFDLFREQMLPAMLEARRPQRKLRIWCAGCSTGQEPYSLSMCLKEMADKVAGWNIDIIGTDLSQEVLEKARAGMYSQFEVQKGMPIQMLVRHFTRTGDMWQIDSGLRAMVRYEPLNLLLPFTHLGKFDIVFCRNVLIYFDPPTKRQVLERIAASLAPDGYLVLGAAETVRGNTTAFEPVKDARLLFRPAASAAAQAKPGPAPSIAAWAG